jgi:hypothetical protein
MFPAHSPSKIVEIFDPALLAGIDRLLAGTVLFVAGWSGNPPLNAWPGSEAARPFQTA